jgi:5'-3' exonuclease
MAKRRLILIDVAGLFRAHWASMGDLEVSEAMHQTVSRVHTLSANYDLCAICCDWPPYRRAKLLPQYKQHREKPSEVMVEQYRRTKERLAADGYLVWQVDGYEADDVIATACVYAKRDELDVTVASSDKDLLCLVDDAASVRVLRLSTGEVYRELEVTQQFGVPPKLIPDLLALMGDKSDNIPGIPLVGPKNGAALLRDFGNAENVFACAGSIKGKVGENIRAHGIERLRLAMSLVKLETDVPIDWDAIYVERKPQKPAEDEDETMSAADDDFENDLAGGGQDRDDEPTSSPSRDTEPPPPPKSEPRASSHSIELSTQPKRDALAVTQPADWSLALEPTSTEKAWTMAAHLFKSRMYPQYPTPEAVFGVILRGRALGIDATTALSLFHCIEGRLAMHADLVVGLVLRSGKAEFFDLTQLGHASVTYATKRKGARKEVEVTWTLDDAARAGLVTKDAQGRYRGVSRSGKPSNWDKYPRAMLRHRAATELARAVYPDVTAGIYTPEELGDERVIEAELVG